MLNSLRKHIVFYGLRNAGKSSLVNAIAGQDVALVSPIKGTTTDPVQKSMEILPLGPVVLIDTPGIDDTGDLGSLRVDRAEKTIDKTDSFHFTFLLKLNRLYQLRQHGLRQKLHIYLIAEPILFLQNLPLTVLWFFQRQLSP